MHEPKAVATRQQSEEYESGSEERKPFLRWGRVAFEKSSLDALDREMEGFPSL